MRPIPIHPVNVESSWPGLNMGGRPSHPGDSSRLSRNVFVAGPYIGVHGPNPNVKLAGERSLSSLCVGDSSGGC